jgi:hypothetical protein
VLGNEPRHVEGLRPWIAHYNLLCKSLDQIERLISEYILHRMATIIGETGLILSRTRALLAPVKPMLRILDRIKPLAKRAAKR